MKGRSRTRDHLVVVLAFAVYVVCAPSLLFLGESRFTMISLLPVIIAGLVLGQVGGFVAGVLALPLNLVLVGWLRGDPLLLFATFGGTLGSALSILVGGLVGRVAGMRNSATSAQRTAEMEADRAFAFAPVGMLVLSHEGTIDRTNEAFRAFHGAPEDDLVGRRWLDFVAEHDRMRIESAIRTLASGEADQVERTVTWTPTWGSPRLALITLSLLDPDAARSSKLLAHLTDLSELHKLNLTLRETIESKNQFLSAIAHEIRTPLTMVVGFVEELSGRLDQLGRDELIEFVTTTKLAAWDISDTVEDLLAVSRLESDLISINEEVIDLMELAAEVAAYRRAHNADARPALIPSAERLLVRCDPVRVRQILRNLLHNAEIHGGPHVEVEGSASGGFASITVSDDGGEPDPDLVDHLFDRRDPGPSGRGPNRSLGMGLHLSQALAHRMGGDISYERESDRTTFTLTLPRAVPDAPHSLSSPDTRDAGR